MLKGDFFGLIVPRDLDDDFVLGFATRDIQSEDPGVSAVYGHLALYIGARKPGLYVSLDLSPIHLKATSLFRTPAMTVPCLNQMVDAGPKDWEPIRRDS